MQSLVATANGQRKVSRDGCSRKGSALGRVLANTWAKIRTPPRIQGFEFCDQPWLRGVWREAYMDGLNLILRVSGIYGRMCKPFARWTRAAGHPVVQDLASGGGRPIASLVKQAGLEGVSLPKIVLSDLHPDLDAFRRIAEDYPGKIDYVATSVNAGALEKDEPRMFSICGAFHHFSPAVARRVLGHLTTRGDGIFIQEVFTRHWLNPLLCIFNLIPLMLAPFFSGRLSLRRVLISTVLPIVPLMIMADGVASIFRTYRPEEIIAMAPESARRDWHWELGHFRVLGFLRAPFVYGFRPGTASFSEDHAS